MLRRRQLLATTASAAWLLAAGGCTTTTAERSPQDAAAERRAVDGKADAALTKLFTQVPSARELTAKARGVLVMPEVISAGLGVGGTYGEGALRAGGATIG